MPVGKAPAQGHHMPSTASFTSSSRRGIIAAIVITALAVASLAAGVTVIVAATGGVNLSSPPGKPHPRSQLASLDSYIVPGTATQRYIVKNGDTLAGISQREYGRYACWPGIYRQNRHLVGSDPNLIEVHQRLAIPAHCDAAPLSTPSPRPAVHPVTIDVQEPSAPASAGSILGDVTEVFGAGASCAVEILDHESGTSWADVTIANPSSGAYGLPQALPGSKMAAFGADWATNPVTQLRWMASYVDATYGGVCNAAAHDLSTGTY